jgi:hypothetical protein
MSIPTAILPPIENLDGRLNYSDWKFGMMLYLKDLGIWNSVDAYPTGDTTTETQKAQHDAKALTKISRKLQEYDDTISCNKDVALLSHGKKHFPRRCKCWSCGEIGHVRSDCPKKVQNSSMQGTNESSSKQEEIKMSAKKEKTSRI